MRLVRRFSATSEFSAAFRLTKKWHLLAQTGHAAVNGQYSGVATSLIAFATTDASGRNSHYLRCGMGFWLINSWSPSDLPDWLALDRMAEGSIGTHKILAVQLAGRDGAEASGETFQTPMDHRAGLRGTQTGTGTGPV